jgi:hypothetical protein
MLHLIITDEGFRAKIGKGALLEHKDKFSIDAAQKKIDAALLEILTIADRY